VDLNLTRRRSRSILGRRGCDAPPVAWGGRNLAVARGGANLRPRAIAGLGSGAPGVPAPPSWPRALPRTIGLVATAKERNWPPICGAARPRAGKYTEARASNEQGETLRSVGRQGVDRPTAIRSYGRCDLGLPLPSRERNGWPSRGRGRPWTQLDQPHPLHQLPRTTRNDQRPTSYKEPRRRREKGQLRNCASRGGDREPQFTPIHPNEFTSMQTAPQYKRRLNANAVLARTRVERSSRRGDDGESREAGGSGG